MHVVCFSELVLTGLWALWAEHLISTQISQRLAKSLLADIYTVLLSWKILAHLLTWAVSFFVALFMGVKTSRNFMFFRRWLEVVLLWSFSILNYFFTWFHSFSECMCQIHFGLSFSLLPALTYSSQLLCELLIEKKLQINTNTSFYCKSWKKKYINSSILYV